MVQRVSSQGNFFFKYKEINKNENATYQNLWDVGKLPTQEIKNRRAKETGSRQKMQTTKIKAEIN